VEHMKKDFRREDPAARTGGGLQMSKYDLLWRAIGEKEENSARLTFAQIGEIAGLPLDHSFLKYKKELEQYGWRVGKISMKEQTVCFERILSGKDETK